MNQESPPDDARPSPKTRVSSYCFKRKFSPVSLTLGSALLLSGVQIASAATTFTVAWDPVQGSPIGAGINTAVIESIQIKETGTTASTGTTTVKITYPTGVTPGAAGGGTSGFTCTSTATVSTCTRTTAIPVNAIVNIPVAFTPITTGTKSIAANISGGGSAGTVTATALSVQVTTTTPPKFSLGWACPTPGMITIPYACSSLVSNISTAATNGTAISWKSTLPTGLGYVSAASASGLFPCTYAAPTITCTRTTALAANAADTITLNLNPAAVGNFTTSASVTGGGTVGTVKSVSTVTSVLARPDVSAVFAQPRPAPLMVSGMSEIELRVNGAGSSVQPPLHATITLPAGITAPAKFGRVADHWVCVTTGQIINCNYDLPLLAGNNSRLRIPVTPTVAGVLATPFSATVATVPNETNIANNTATLTPAATTAKTATVWRNAIPAVAANTVAAWVAYKPLAAIPLGYDASMPLLDPTSIPKYVMPLPNPNASFFKHVPDTTTVPGTDSYKLDIKQVKAQVLPYGFPQTNVFAYGDPARPDTFTYPAHTIEARSTDPLNNASGLGKPVKVQYLNTLPATTAHLLPVDHSIHGANMGEPDIRSIGHLHGNQDALQESDGFAEAWYSPKGGVTGQPMPGAVNPFVAFNPNAFDYKNNQEATMMWYHDHTMAMTRLNVYAGLAGLYALRDDNEMSLINNNILPSGRYEVPLVFQDRMFKVDGSLAYPYVSQIPDPLSTTVPPALINYGSLATPSAVPEFFGSVMVVNGVSWPYFQVEPRKYRFRILNGSNARFYTMTMRVNGSTTLVPFQVIGTEGGFHATPKQVTSLTVAPAERYDVVVDFSATNLAGRNITIRNSALAPFGRTVACAATAPATCIPPGAPPVVGLEDQIMQFRVNLPLNTAVPNATLAATTALRTTANTLPAPATAARKVLLGETLDGQTRILPMLGTPTATTTTAPITSPTGTVTPAGTVVPGGRLGYMDLTTETPTAGSVETWEIFNSSMDAHPVHLHDSVFQVIERQPFYATWGANGELTNICYSATLPVAGQTVCSATTPPTPVLATENTWKETVIAYPFDQPMPATVGGIVQGQVTRVRVKFSQPGSYVWHCHIVEHEDHDMMRPLTVLP